MFKITVTSSADLVERHLVAKDSKSEPAADGGVTPGRRQWAAPGGTVVRALAERELSMGTGSVGELASPTDSEPTSDPSSTPTGQAYLFCHLF